MKMNQNTTLRINLTGDNELDRINLFNYIVNNFTSDDTEAEVLVLAASFLGNDPKEINSEIRLNPELLVPVCLFLMREEKINLSRRADIGNALVRYADSHAKVIEQTAKKKPVFNFINEFEQALFTKLSQQPVEDILVTFPFFYIYYYRGVIFEANRDYDNAFRMYSKAHQWNPFNPKAIIKILEALKHDKRASDLMRLSMWYLQIVYSLPNISNALRFAGYAQYLEGSFENAYAFYYQSIVYDDSLLPAGFNEEITSVLTALNKKEPYELTKSQIKKLFAYSKEKPFPSEIAFDVVRTLIIDHYTRKEYVDVLRYATHYVILRPNDDKINRILKVSKINLN